MATDSRIPVESAVQTAPTKPVLKSLRARLFFILLASFLVMIIVTAVSFGFMIHSWEGILRTEIERGLTQKAQMFASEVNDHTRSIGALTSQEGQRAGARATVVDMNGKVIADSEVRVTDLDNEGRRPEFAAALHGDTGSDVRSRNSFGIPVLYVAVPVSGGAVRLAYPLADVSIATARATRGLVLGCIVAVIGGLAISAFTAQAVARRLPLPDSARPAL
jgi:two-component system phosphate regulon sensor histidine kinase PhoR